jgi:MGT family glycosyltransferase
LPFQIVLTLGREDGPRPERVPANAKVLGYGPQLALLKRASMVITHAGLNTVLEALTQGLPMVALPIANEQPGIAARIRHAGVGEFLATKGLSASRLRTTIERVHTEPSFRQRARQCANELERVDGLRRAATIVELAIAENRRVTRDDLVAD